MISQRNAFIAPHMYTVQANVRCPHRRVVYIYMHAYIPCTYSKYTPRVISSHATYAIAAKDEEYSKRGFFNGLYDRTTMMTILAAVRENAFFVSKNRCIIRRSTLRWGEVTVCDDGKEGSKDTATVNHSTHKNILLLDLDICWIRKGNTIKKNFATCKSPSSIASQKTCLLSFPSFVCSWSWTEKLRRSKKGYILSSSIHLARMCWLLEKNISCLKRDRWTRTNSSIHPSTIGFKLWNGFETETEY